MDPREDISQLVEARVRSAMKESQQELLQQIGTLVDKISGNPSSSSASQLTVLDIPKFRRKSNEEQFKQNSRVLARLEQADAHLDTGNIPECKNSIAEAKDMVKRRQKHIQLADNSELGWRVVTEYEANPIASDSEDEKRMYRAEARASRKAKLDRFKKKNRGVPYNRPVQDSSHGSVGQGSSGRRPGLCFVCGKGGHWKNECPQAQTNNKISIYDLFFIGKGTRCNRGNVKVESSDFVGSEKASGHEGGHSVRSIEGNIELSPVGRLRQHKENWEKVTDSAYILTLIESGYRLPFKTIPPPVKQKNNKSARDNPTFVTEQISVLLKKGVISKVLDRPVVVNPLTVAYKLKPTSNRSLK